MKNNPFLRQLGEYFDTFLPEIRKMSKNTISAYGDSIAVFLQFVYETKGLDHTKITYKHFTAALFDDFLFWLKNERKYSVSSVRHRMTAITSFLKYASRREMSAVSAYSNAFAVEKPNGTQTAFPYFTLEEMKILLSIPNTNKYLGDRDIVLLSLMYEAGARAQEICDLCVGDIKFSKTTKVKLHGKNDKIREVPIADEVANLIRYHLKKQNLINIENKRLQLFSSQTNEQMTTSCVRSIVKKYVGIAKRENPSLFLENNYSPHSFRHSKAVHMVEAGVALIYIRNFLGHSTISSTEIYARVGQSAVTKALTERKIPILVDSPPQIDSAKLLLPDCLNRARQ